MLCITPYIRKQRIETNRNLFSMLINKENKIEEKKIFVMKATKYTKTEKNHNKEEAHDAESMELIALESSLVCYYEAH